MRELLHDEASAIGRIRALCLKSSEFRSRPDRPHPLFTAFVKAAIRYADGEQLGLESDDEGGIRTAIPVEGAAVRA